MNDRAALVTGGARRLGAAIARGLAAQGYTIALHCRRSTAAAAALADELAAAGTACRVYEADLADRDALLGLVGRVTADFPGLALLVNNAAVFERSTVAGTEWDLFERQWQVNLRAPFFLLRDFARHAAGARITDAHVVNLLDTKIARHGSAYAAYLLAKHALAELTAMAAREFAPGIRVNGVAPGYALLPDGLAPEEQAAHDRDLVSRIPLARAGTPAEIVDAVLYLDRQQHVTGQILFVDGGMHL